MKWLSVLSVMRVTHVYRDHDTTRGSIKAHEWLARMTDEDHDDMPHGEIAE
jgi:hypothetical protein